MSFWHRIHQILAANQNLYLLTVVESTGSAPGKSGFKMIVAGNGELFGTIGGGIMEYNLVERAKENLKSSLFQSFIVKQVHQKHDKNSSGMICSGSQTISFVPLLEKNLSAIEQCLNQEQMIELSSYGFSIINFENQSGFENVSENDWYYRELINHKPKVHIFGAGHVSFATSELLSKLNFDLHLYDNRENINTFDNNHFVSEKSIIDYKTINQYIEVKEKDYVLIMTHKFFEDKLILSQLISQTVKYLGVLGSKSKMQALFSELTNEGFSKTQLEQINTPIGLSINSETTDEIAVSIAAELIKVKNS
ncbi:MAG: XdhC family protein [Gammaproteobacteria bacterium]|jgi:xanthine dehydrogenase accessory factor|nr:XdhC family protein [Xanthomonadales bacterium]